jgi:hypothetical protein
MMNDFKIDKLSLIGRAAEAYATGDLTEVKQRAEQLYLGKRYPFVINAEYTYPLHLFSPRLTTMLGGDAAYPDAQDVWQVITARENIIRMISMTSINRTAAEILGPQFQEIYPQESIDVKRPRKQMIGYMIKIVMESFGYIVSRGRMQIDTNRRGAESGNRRTNYFKSATRYTKMTISDRDAFLDQIKSEDVKQHFTAITDLIIEGRTEYQKVYRINELTNWDSL